MAMSLSSIERSHGAKAPPRILLYGGEGVGKTTLAAHAPRPIFVWTEDGTGKLEVEGFPLATSFQEVLEALGALAEEPHDYKTVVVDSLDWLEPLIWSDVCRAKGWDGIEAPGYGKGYVEADRAWSRYLQCLDYLRAERGMIVIQIAHAIVRTFNDPERDAFDRWQVKLHKSASARMKEASDAVLFANVKISTRTTADKKVKGTGGAMRALWTEDRAAFEAKNRFGLPFEIPYPPPTEDGPDRVWATLAQHIPYLASMEIPNG